MAQTKIRAEYSAQPSSAQPNPLVEEAIQYLSSRVLKKTHLRVVDQGCGRLRHLRILLSYFDDILLVDTQHQFNRNQAIFGQHTTLKAYAKGLDMAGKTISLCPAEEFGTLHARADLIFSVAVMDVVLAATRALIVRDAYANLRVGGFYVVIVPRNDSSILRRCNEGNRCQDGHRFAHHNVETFYRNFRDHTPIRRHLGREGFALERDLSRYRQVCLIMRRE